MESPKKLSLKSQCALMTKPQHEAQLKIAQRDLRNAIISSKSSKWIETLKKEVSLIQSFLRT